MNAVPLLHITLPAPFLWDYPKTTAKSVFNDNKGKLKFGEMGNAMLYIYGSCNILKILDSCFEKNTLISSEKIETGWFKLLSKWRDNFADYQTKDGIFSFDKDNMIDKSKRLVKESSKLILWINTVTSKHDSLKKYLIKYKCDGLDWKIIFKQVKSLMSILFNRRYSMQSPTNPNHDLHEYLNEQSVELWPMPILCELVNRWVCKYIAFVQGYSFCLCVDMCKRT